MSAASIVFAAALCLGLGAQVDTDDAVFAVRSALDAGDYRRAEVLMDDVAAEARPLLAARLHFEVGDFLGCTRIAADALATAPVAQHRELTWWGAKAALWLQDAAGAEAWTAQLARACAGDAAWESVARDYAALGAELTRGAADERRALVASRWTVAAIVLLVATGALGAFRRGAPK